jgi:hypothetical protein
VSRTGRGSKVHLEPPLSSLAFGNASRTFQYHTGRVAGLALYYQCRDCAASPSRPPGSPQRETLLPDPRPLAPATWCAYATLPNRPARLRSPVHTYTWRAPVEEFFNC